MGGKATSTSGTKLNQISVQSSTLGVPITAGWGRARINCNLLWYGAFNAISHTTKQSGGKGLGGSVSNTTYTYTASIIMGLCEGGATGITGIRTVYRDKSAMTLSAAGLSLATGTATQAVWGYLTTKFPAQAINYSGIAYVYAQDYALNDSATLPNHSFEVDFGIQLAGAANGDADPKDIVTDCLTSTAYGVPGWPTGMIGDLSDWSLYCRANNLLLSPVLDSQRSGQDFFTEIATATNSEFFWSEGLLKAASYGDSVATGNSVTWTPNLTPDYDLTEDDLIPVDGKPVKLNIVDQSNAFNIVQVEFLDRTNQYNVGIQTAQDLADIVQNGKRKQDPTTVHSICDPTIAQTACQLLLQRTLYMREEYTFTLPDNFGLLECMDTVTLTTTTDELKLNRKQVRIVQIDEQADGTFQITAKGMNIGTASAALYNAHSGSGYVPNIDGAPGSVSTPILINAPTSLTGGSAEVWIAAGSTNSNWGGCEVWVSADNIQYHRVGVITAAARTGVSTATLASHADPDTTNTLAVDLSASNGTLSNSNSANANIGSTLCLIGSEIVAYQTATLTSAYHYGLTNLRRGLYGTTIASHTSGETFCRLDEALFKYDYGSLALGTTIYVKLPSFNIFGRALEDISTVLAYTVTLSPNVTIGSGSLQSFTLQNRANCYIDGRTVSKITGGTAWNGSVVSSESFIGGCMMGFQPLQNNLALMMGLNSDPATDDSYTSLDFAWYTAASGFCEAWQNGAAIAAGGAYSPGDTFQITYQGTTVSWMHNGSVVYTATVAANLQLWLDSSFNDVGAKATNVTFAGTGAGANGYSSNVVTLWQRAASAPTTLPSVDMTYTFATQALSPAPNNSWSATEPAPNGLPLWITEQLAYANTPTVLLPHGSWTAAVQDTEGVQTIVVVLYQRSATTPSVPSGTLTYTYSSGAVSGATLGSWTTADPGGTNPCYKIQALAVAPSGSATASILTSGWSTPAIYSQNGAAGAGSFTLINQSGTTISGNSVTKTGGTNGAYDAAARTQESFANGATIGFTGPASGQEAIVGLSANPTAGNSYTNCDYGIVKRSAGTWEIWEGGSYTGVSGSSANGAQFQVTYDNTQIIYQQGSTVIKTTSVASGKTLFGFMSLEITGTVVAGISFAKAGSAGTGGGSTATTSPISSTNSGGGSGNSTTTIVGNQFKTTSPVTMSWDGQIYYSSGGLGTVTLTFYLEYTTDPQRTSGWTTCATNGPISFNSAVSPYDNSFSGTFTPAANTAYYFRLRSASSGAAILVNVVGGLTATQ